MAKTCSPLIGHLCDKIIVVVVKALAKVTKAKFRRRTSHEPNRVLIRKNKGFFSFAFDSVHGKYSV